MKRWGNVFIHDQWMPITLAVGMISWVYYAVDGKIIYPAILTTICLLVLSCRLLRAHLILRHNTVCLGVLKRTRHRAYRGMAEYHISYSHEGTAYSPVLSYKLGAFPENNVVTLYIHPKNPARYVVYEIQDAKDII
jgi:hypothetical protein